MWRLTNDYVWRESPTTGSCTVDWARRSPGLWEWLINQSDWRRLPMRLRKVPGTVSVNSVYKYTVGQDESNRPGSGTVGRVWSFCKIFVQTLVSSTLTNSNNIIKVNYRNRLLPVVLPVLYMKRFQDGDEAPTAAMIAATTTEFCSTSSTL